MKRPELYHKTVDILVQAYFNDTLEHTNCYACAVGNIIAANCGYRFKKATKKQYTGAGKLAWDSDLNIRNVAVYYLHLDEKLPQGIMEQIISTGYSDYQLCQIEMAFETAPKGNDDDEWMFNGLLACVDTLDEIHENKDSQITKDTKKKFNREQNVAKRERIVETDAQSRP